MTLSFGRAILRKSGLLFAILIFAALYACARNTDKNPLAMAAERGDLSGMQQLMEQGADINAKDSEGLDALAYAVINDHPEAVSYLLKQGANANTADVRGITAMIISATVGDEDIVRKLHENGAKINQPTNDGVTALMAAAGSDNHETTELLLSLGANPCLRDKNNMTALQTAEEWRGTLETARAVQRNAKLAPLECDQGGKRE